MLCSFLDKDMIKLFMCSLPTDSLKAKYKNRSLLTPAFYSTDEEGHYIPSVEPDHLFI